MGQGRAGSTGGRAARARQLAPRHGCQHAGTLEQFLPPHGARASAGAAPGARLAAVRHELVLPQAGLGALGGREEAEHPEDDQRRQVQEHDGRDRLRLRAAPAARAPHARAQRPPRRARAAAMDARRGDRDRAKQPRTPRCT